MPNASETAIAPGTPPARACTSTHAHLRGGRAPRATESDSTPRPAVPPGRTGLAGEAGPEACRGHGRRGARGRPALVVESSAADDVAGCGSAWRSSAPEGSPGAGQTHRPPPAGAGSVVNRCGGGWERRGQTRRPPPPDGPTPPGSKESLNPVADTLPAPRLRHRRRYASCRIWKNLRSWRGLSAGRARVLQSTDGQQRPHEYGLLLRDHSTPMASTGRWRPSRGAPPRGGRPGLPPWAAAASFAGRENICDLVREEREPGPWGDLVTRRTGRAAIIPPRSERVENRVGPRSSFRKGGGPSGEPLRHAVPIGREHPRRLNNPGPPVPRRTDWPSRWPPPTPPAPPPLQHER